MADILKFARPEKAAALPPADIFESSPTAQLIFQDICCAIGDCSTRDYYDISNEGVQNLAYLATKAVLDFLDSTYGSDKPAS